MTEFSVGNLKIPYTLTRSEAAKNVRIEMTMDAMRVTAPAAADVDTIQSALYKKRQWIVEKHTDLRAKYEQTHKIARFRTGAKIPYWGRLAKITTLEHDCSKPIVEYKGQFVVRLQNKATAQEHDDTVETALRMWMRCRLKAEARGFCQRYAKKLGVDFAALRVAELSKIWGSCGANGTVSLDWHLVFAPKRVLQYVITHELTHLVERNHSAAFWKTVQTVYGDYEREHTWLVQNEHLLGYKRIPLDHVSAQRASYSAQTSVPAL